MCSKRISQMWPGYNGTFEASGMVCRMVECVVLLAESIVAQCFYWCQIEACGECASRMNALSSWYGMTIATGGLFLYYLRATSVVFSIIKKKDIYIMQSIYQITSSLRTLKIITYIGYSLSYPLLMKKYIKVIELHYIVY